jgi:hypothetical protein
VKDDLAAQRGKRGIITIKAGDVVRTLAMPPADTRDPLEVMRRRARKPKTSSDSDRR